MALADPAIELADVDLSLGQGAARVHILRGLSLTIARGEAVGLLGASGSGKSTLLMTIAGLERPDRGRSSSTARGSTTWARTRWRAFAARASASSSNPFISSRP